MKRVACFQCEPEDIKGQAFEISGRSTALVVQLLVGLIIKSTIM